MLETILKVHLKQGTVVMNVLYRKKQKRLLDMVPVPLRASNSKGSTAKYTYPGASTSCQSSGMSRFHCTGERNQEQVPNKIGVDEAVRLLTVVES